MGNGIALLVVAAVGERPVNVTKHRLGTGAVYANDNAIGVEEIGNRGAFTQELGVRSYVKGIRFCPVAQDDLANPFAGVDRNRAFLNNNFVVIDGAGNLAGNRFDIREIGFTVAGRRSSHGNKNRSAVAHRLLQIVGKSKPESPMAFQQFGQETFVNRDIATF